jgi:integrase
MGYYVAGAYEQRSTGVTDERRARRALRQRVAEVRARTYVGSPRRVTLDDLLRFIRDDYIANQRRSLATLEFQCRHLRDYFGSTCWSFEITTSRLQRYVSARRSAGAAASSIRGELSHLARALKLAERAGLISGADIPYVPQVKPDPSRIRQGFITRAQLDDLCRRLDADSADFVRFLFFSAWRAGEARNLGWRDYDPTSAVFRLRADATKTGQPRLLPIAGELASIINRRLSRRRVGCEYVFHRNGARIGRFLHAWRRACAETGIGRRLLHDLRRSGIKHLVERGVDQRRAMAISGHRTVATFHRYQIVDLVSLRQAIEMASPALAQPHPRRRRTGPSNRRTRTERNQSGEKERGQLG